MPPNSSNFVFNNVTLGPDANHKNGFDFNNITTDESKLSVSNLISRSNVTVAMKKILLESEVQRREKVKRAVEKKKQEMERYQREMLEELSDLLSRTNVQREKETAEISSRLAARNVQIYRKNLVQRKNQVKSEDILKKLVPFQYFNAEWKEITNIPLACQEQHLAARLSSSYLNKLSQLSQQMKAIHTKARNAVLTSTDIKMTEIIAESSGKVYELFKSNIDYIEALYDQEIARREQEMKRAQLTAQEEVSKIKQTQEMVNPVKVPVQQEQQQPQQSVIQKQQGTEVNSSKEGLQAPQSIVSTVKGGEVTPDQNPDNECLQIYVNSMQFLQNYATKYQTFAKSDSVKKLRFEVQKTINITINTISLGSRDQLIEKYNKLKTFLSGNGTINILQDQQIECFAKNLLAQKIVDQGDKFNCELASPIGAIAVALWNDFPDFGELLLAKFRTKSPFFVPTFFEQRNDQSKEDYYKTLGCKYNENGTPENPDEFLRRLGGTMYLYASIIVSKQRQDVNKPHPHGLGNAWRWLTEMISTEPRCDTADICATLIYVMLKVTGHDLWQTYSSQFAKMLAMLYNVYFVKVTSINPVVSAPVSRLGEFLNEAIKTGGIQVPKNQLPADFW